VLTNINADLRKELAWLTSIAEYHPKNYQIWHHRKEIVKLLGDTSLEKNLTDLMIDQDDKNYHAWGYR
jgi:protein farnesyltransferase/geranylgeranyltransferase type-1 subunit alpha